MAGMVRSQRPHGPRRRVLVAGVLTSAVLVLAGCSGDGSGDPPTPTSAPSEALRVTTVSGGEALDTAVRTQVEVEVGDVLSGYVVRAFLGEYPRDDFVPAFDSFTSGAARKATQDIDVLTASRYADASGVRATSLDARLSWLVSGRDVVGATAGVRFDFEVSAATGETVPISLRGRFMLVEDAGTWSVFGYDVSRSDGAEVRTEVSS